MDLNAIWLEQLKGERRLTRETITAMADGDMQFRPGQMVTYLRLKGMKPAPY